MSVIAIPRHIDDQPQLLFWELDEFILAAACFSVGILMGGWFTPTSIFASLFVIRSFRRYKSGQMAGVLHHILYAAGLMSLNKRYQSGAYAQYFH